MPTVITRYLNTNSTAGGDGTTNNTSGATRAYASAQEAFDGIYAAYPNMITSDVSIIVECTGHQSSTETANTNAIVTDETHTITLRALNPSERFSWSSTFAIYLISPPNVTRNFRLQDIDFSMTRRSEFGNQIMNMNPESSSPAVVVEFVNCTGFNAEVDYGSRWFTSSGISPRSIRFVNCLSINFNGLFRAGYNGSSATSFVYNTTALGVKNLVFDVEYSNPNTLVVKNSIFQGTGGELLNGFLTGSNILSGSSDKILTSDASSPTTSLRNKTLTFANSGSFDFRLAATDTDAIGTGLNLSTDSLYAFNTDISGSTRSVPWSLGAFDYATDISYPVNFVFMRPNGAGDTAIVSNNGPTWFYTL